jgi:Zn-dependent oligopeptidase
MTYSDNHEFRKQSYIANHSNCSKNNEYNNLEIMKKIKNCSNIWVQDTCRFRIS